MEQEKLISFAEELYKAQVNPSVIDPLTERISGIDIAGAYKIQEYITQKNIKSGRRIVGQKIGLTSLAMQKLLNVSEPDYGVLYDDRVYPQGSILKRSQMIQPKIEAEIGFLLKEDLSGPNVTEFRVLQACQGIFPCMEIIDSRIKDWKIKIQDTIADNASCWGVVTGTQVSNPLGIDYRVLGLAVYKNNKLVDTAAGAAVLGNPLTAVSWLANKLHEYGKMLRAGDIVLAGALMSAFPIEQGDYVQAVFDRIGEVSVAIE